jgi:type I restriction enzyme M protein
MLNQEIKNKINRLWDLFWSGGMANPLTALEQISYLLFMRRAEDVGLITEDYYKWSFYTKQDIDLSQYMKGVFDYLKTQNIENDSFTSAMDGANFEITKTSLLVAAIELIDEIYSIANKEREQGQHFQDTLGDFYELILNQTGEAGKNGQFRTPRHIIQLMCEILEPSIDDTICDVTAGTSGFLVGAYQYIISKNSSEEPKIDENGFEKRNSGNLIDLGSEKEEKLTKNTFYGYDIDATMIRLGMMNLIMHNIKEPKIKHIDSLSEKFDAVEKGVQYSKILANPPFTGRIDSLEATTSSLIYPAKRDRLGMRVKQTIQSEILFLERIIQLLEIDGKAAVIIPEGILFGSAKAPTKIREILLKNCTLDGVISLPSGVFMPYTGVKTSILIFTKRKLKKNGYNTEKVWFYGMDMDGYSLDANRKPLKDKPLPKVRDAFILKEQLSNFDTSKKHFFVEIDKITENNFQLGFNQYKKFEYENQDYEEPKILLQRLVDLEREIFKGLDELIEIV